MIMAAEYERDGADSPSAASTGRSGVPDSAALRGVGIMVCPRHGESTPPVTRHTRSAPRSRLRQSGVAAALGFVLASSALSAWSDDTTTAASDIAALLPVARSTAGELANRLKAPLQTALAAGGPMSALEVCQTVAPAIGHDLSATYEGEVGRTALRVRNPANAPDAFERRVLAAFAAEAAKGVDVSSLEHAEIIAENGRRVFRYMKAIPMLQTPCGSCHGVSIAPDLLRGIQARYPQDAAVGFVPGEMRGAFTLSKTLR